MSTKLQEATKEEFAAFLQKYPRALQREVVSTCEPPLVTFNDFFLGQEWPESVVASYVASDPPSHHRILDNAKAP